MSVSAVLTVDESRLLIGIADLNSQKEKKWIQSDLSVSESSLIGRFFFTYFAKYFTCLRSSFFDIDLQKSKEALIALRNKISPDDESLAASEASRTLFNDAIRSFNAIAPRHAIVAITQAGCLYESGSPIRLPGSPDGRLRTVREESRYDGSSFASHTSCESGSSASLSALSARVSILTQDEKDKLTKLSELNSQKDKSWVLSDLSLRPSSHIERIFYTYFAKHFECLRECLYEIDLKESKTALENIKSKITKAVKDDQIIPNDLIELFNGAVKSFNGIAPNHKVKRLESSDLDSEYRPRSLSHAANPASNGPAVFCDTSSRTSSPVASPASQSPFTPDVRPGAAKRVQDGVNKTPAPHAFMMSWSKNTGKEDGDSAPLSEGRESDSTNEDTSPYPLPPPASILRQRVPLNTSFVQPFAVPSVNTDRRDCFYSGSVLTNDVMATPSATHQTTPGSGTGTHAATVGGEEDDSTLSAMRNVVTQSEEGVCEAPVG